MTGPTATDMLGQLPRALGEPPVSGRIRSIPADFRVEEVLGFEADGAGNHVMLQVEKTAANTSWVAGELARNRAVASRDVGFAGHKDRNAVAVQWFTLPLPANDALGPLAALAGPGYRVLSARRHGRKLRPGSHRSNRFGIVVRDVCGPRAELEERLRGIAQAGVPNYFGPQRFGQDMANLRCARDWALTGRAPRQRSRRGFALSAARSWLFNLVLAERVRRGDWAQLLAGEAAMLDDSRSFFSTGVPDAELIERCLRMDVHPSGPLWGEGQSPASASALELEIRATDGEAALRQLLESQRLRQERRSLRLRVKNLAWRIDDDVLHLWFELPRGAFATAVLYELLQGAWDA
jgi:tRNA pseudouridine13 synthase